MITGFVLAGNRREYSRYLYANGLKERDWPQLRLYVQLQGYHEPPPIVCVGTYWQQNKLREIRLRAQTLGFDVTSA